MRSRICVILFLAVIARADRCDPPAQIADFVRALPQNGAARHAAIEPRLASQPDDFWLNRLYLDSTVYEHSSVRERYKKGFEARPDSIDGQYLYARSLVGFNTKESLRIYARIFQNDPDYPWAHFSQLEIFNSPVFRDRAKLQASFETLTGVCPAWIEPYKYLNSMEGDIVSRSAIRLREMLERSANPNDAYLYPVLWSAEFKVRPKSEEEAEKRRIAEDLKRLRALDADHSVIANGAKLIGDTELAKEMTPPPKPDLNVELQKFQKEHPYPRDNDLPEKRRAFAEAQLEFATRLIAMFPDQVSGYYDRFHALDQLDAPVEQLAQAGDDIVRVARNRGFSGATFIDMVPATYVRRGILLDRVPALIDSALTQLDEGLMRPDLVQDPITDRRFRMEEASYHVDVVVTLSEYYEKLGQIDKARAALAPVPGYLAKKGVLDPVSEDQRREPNLIIFRGMAQYSYWHRLAEVDEMEGKKEDALTHGREALLTWEGRRDKELAHQRQLWKDLGRSDEDWQAWVDSIPKGAWRGEPTVMVSPSFELVHRALPKITLRNLDGNEWPADRFASKTTIAVVWATWCGPCVQELPYFAKLAEQLKGREDVQVISFNMDDNVELARRFIASQGYTFAVLAAKNFVEDLMPYLSIPRTWIIRDGAIVEESIGFGVDKDQWVDHLAGKLQ